MLKRNLMTGLAILGVSLAQGATPLWLRDVKISPDGKEIAFTYQGDIYKVPVSGGEAVRLTSTPSYEQTPVWSPDGKTIAFESDRAGSGDIYIMSSAGGQATRLTSFSGNEVPEAFTPDGKYVMFSATIQDPVESAQFPSARLTELYKVPTSGGRATQMVASTVQMPDWSADGKYFVYQDYKGTENEWRKHHTSSVTRDIWKYEPATGRHSNLTQHAGEDRNPLVSGDKLIFLSERNGGSMNVYELPLANPGGTPKALTNFKEHPVRFLSQGADGTLAMAYDGEIYTMRPGGKPTKVAIDIVLDSDNPIEYMPVMGGASGSMPSPDGSMVAFTKRGDVFVTSVDYSSTKQITSTPAAEKDVAWSKDGRTLYYTSERDGKKNIYRASIVRKEDPNFPNATLIKEEPVFSTSDKTDRESPVISPDGKMMAFVADRSRLMVMNLADKKVRELVPAKYNGERGGVDFAWSPDSKWITFSMVDNMHAPYSNIGLVNVEGTPEISTVTSSGYFDMDPKWNAAGDAIIFLSDRYGMRNHASWGSERDVMAVFMNQDALDRFQLSEEDAKLLKDAEKKQKSEADKADKEKSGDKKDAKSATEKKGVEIDRNGFEFRTVRLTPYSSDISSAETNSDFDKLYYISSPGKGSDLWKLDLRKGDASIVSKLTGGGNLIPDASRKSLFLTGGSIRKMDLPGEKIKFVTFNGTMKLDHAAEREAMFNDMKRQEAERFYVKDMHGVDWEKLTEHYRKFLPHISNNYDFSEMLSEILGELNVSHTGSGYRAPGAKESTGTLGLLYDLSHKGKGLLIAEVVEGSPMSMAKSMAAPGVIVESVNSIPVDENTDLTELFNGTVGKKTLVELYNPKSGERKSEVVRPISPAQMQDLLYRRWVKGRAADVERLSNGRLGYVHIKGMNDDSFRTIYADIFGKYNEKEGIVIDTRFNGGGRLHEDIEVLFSGKKYLNQVKRGVKLSEMPSRRWNKPSIMIQGEANYSNAHGTPWVYKHQGLGKLVGMPVPGTMTSVSWVTLQDPTLYFGIPQTGWQTDEGYYLENCQLEPDIKVANEPEQIVKGRDQQLERAVEELLRDIDKAKK